MFDEHLVHALVGGKDSNRGSADLSVNLGWTIGASASGHGSYSLTHHTSAPSADRSRKGCSGIRNTAQAFFEALFRAYLNPRLVLPSDDPPSTRGRTEV